MEEPPLSKEALARIKGARLEAGAGLLKGLAGFWRGAGMSRKKLRVRARPGYRPRSGF